MTKLELIHAIVGLFLIAFTHTAFGQPYLYKYRPLEDPRYAVVCRTNLATGLEEIFLPDTMRIMDVESDPSQKWIYISERGGFKLVDADNRKNVYEPLKPRRIDGIDGVLYLQRMNRFYVTWLAEAKGEYSASTHILDASTFSTIDSTPVSIGYGAIVSDDEGTVYQYGVDSSGYRFIYSYSTATNSLGDEIPFSDIGPPTERKITHGGARGRILISFSLPSDEQKYSTHCQVFDLEAKRPFPDIFVPWKSEAYLTGDAKTIVVEEVSLALSPLGNRRYRPGNICIFETATGKLKRKLSLPPDGVVMLFDTYPDRFFYYNELTRQSISGDVTSVTSVVASLDSLVALLHQAETDRWIGDGRFVQTLNHVLQDAKRQFGAGDTIGCARQLESFQERIWEEYHDKPRSHDKRFVTEDGYISLYFNAGYVTGRLINLPLRSYAALAEQLDSLKAEIKQQRAEKNLGGVLLVRGLELLVDQAKRNLQRKDSVRASRDLALFQALVWEVNELTRGGWKKNKHHPSLYLTDKAYVELYYRAQYIIEALPAHGEEDHKQQRVRMDREPELAPLGKELDSLKLKLEQK